MSLATPPLVRLALLCLLALPGTASAAEWLRPGPDGARQVVLYYFYSDTCPHCKEARPFVAALGERDWIALEAREITKDRDNARRYYEMARALGQKASSVPAFIFCGTVQVGYDREETTGAALLEELEACRADPDAFLGAARTAAAPAPGGTDVPVLGLIDPDDWALPVLTVAIAGLDAFNPCAFFVLLFLLSLMVHARSRPRMLLVGGLFVTVSGLVYFAFMAAWLNAFLLLGELRWVTLAAGGVAVLLALINIKDYFWFRRGVSLSIPESKKPGLYQRMRGLVSAESLGAVLVGTVLLAVAANSYELLCTAGFPMVYTRILTMRAVDPGLYYLYLGLYNVVYVIPLLIIVVLFVMRFGARKLGEGEGRLLKLLSGMMMLGLGGLMLVHPEGLNQVGTALGLLVAAGVATWLLHTASRRRGLL
jgi:thiol-disulfide isomerase/thioredoxin